MTARRDAALAAQFPAPPPAAAPAAVTPAVPGADKPAAPAPAATPAAPKPAAQTVERLTARATGVEYEIPSYKYDALFKPQEELLEKLPEKAAKK